MVRACSPLIVVSLTVGQIAMRSFTTALVHRIGHPSLASRTLFLFELAMERAHYRYGRRARLVAGASLAIALRESQKGETVKDIAVCGIF